MAQSCEEGPEGPEEESWCSKASKECYESCGCIGWGIGSAGVIGWIYCNCWLSGQITETLQGVGVRNDIAFLISIVICFLNYVFTPVFVLSVLNLPCVIYFRNYETTNPCIIYWCKMGAVPEPNSTEQRTSPSWPTGQYTQQCSSSSMLPTTSEAAGSSRAVASPGNGPASKVIKKEVVGPPSYAECIQVSEEDPPDYATALGRIV